MFMQVGSVDYLSYSIALLLLHRWQCYPSLARFQLWNHLGHLQVKDGCRLSVLGAE